MLWTIATAALGYLRRIPWQAWLVLAVVVSAWLWGNARYADGRNDERNRQERLREVAIRKGLEIARQADQNALEKSQGVKDGIEAGNDAARAAAAGSDDPLRDAMEAIR